ncbi:MAG TPA: MXAN_5187 C-terminal domain-containing protein [Thermoanaerobaculia bacterium]|nr:MXAN_5187 C-terminal domain-containing protein [Thermoanaerobaculia bacterium]
MDPKRPYRPGAAPGQQNPQAPAAAAKRPGAGGPVPPQAAVRKGPAISEALDQLQRDIRQLQVDFERFFNGGLPLPPEELRGRIQALLRNLRNTSITAPVDNFRLGDLEARFNSYNEMFNRRLRDVEEGRGPHRVFAFVEKQRFDARGGIVFGSEIDSEAAEALYRGLASGAGDGPKFDLDSFQTYLRRQTEAIRQKTGCDEVQFRVAEEDGKLKLKARPVPAR